MALGTGEHLRVDERSFAAELEMVEHGPAEQLRREVDIANLQPEREPDHEVVDGGEGLASKAFTTALDAIRAHDVGVVGIEQGEHAPDVLEVDGKVGVGIEDDVAVHYREARADGRPKSPVRVVVDDHNPSVAGRELIGECASAVGGRVVDEHELDAAYRRALNKGVARTPSRVDKRGECFLFVPHRRDDAETLVHRCRHLSISRQGVHGT